MRTTLDIDSDVLNLAKALAESRKTSIGKALSDLARRGINAQTPVIEKNGFFVFDVPEDTPSFGPEDVQAALNADDQEYASQFLDPNRR